MPTFKSLFEENQESLKHDWVAGRSSIGNPLDTPANALSGGQRFFRLVQ